MTDSASTDYPIVAPKKLIEVALPLEQINEASAYEKNIRHGHPSTIHLWWARRPLAAARSVLFAQLVNDPAWKYTEEEQAKPAIKSVITRKRNELFKLISQLANWSSTNNEKILSKARSAILDSWRETCDANKNHPNAESLFDPKHIPEFHDPFAGGGAIPLEAQRLGLRAIGSDLNPVAVLINKAMIEIPARFSGRSPIGPVPNKRKQTQVKGSEEWSGAKGLAEDVLRYGIWLQDRMWERVGELYPKIMITKEILKERPDLIKYANKELTVIAWLWARTVASPNPAMNGAVVPLVNSFWLAQKHGKEAWVEPTMKQGRLRFKVHAGRPQDTETISKGTKSSRGNFKCFVTSTPIPPEHIKTEGLSGRLGSALMAIVCEGERERVYLSPTDEHSEAAKKAVGKLVPDTQIPDKALGFRVQAYGFKKHKDLFSSRQQLALGTIAQLVAEIRKLVLEDTLRAGWERGERLEQGGNTGEAYADSIAVYMTMLLARCADFWSTLATWSPAPKNEIVGHTFTMQTITMTWDYGEINPFSSSGGSLLTNLEYLAKAVSSLFGNGFGRVEQGAAQSVDYENRVVSTDPPYYDNIGYADLSDYFYVWERSALKSILPDLFGSILTPKTEELISNPFRHASQEIAENFFLTQMSMVFSRLGKKAHPAFPITIYYAFKQVESNNDGVSSRGWVSFLQSIHDSQLRIMGTWPIRTERGSRSRGIDSNALASSIVLVCRPRAHDAATISRRDFVRELEQALPVCLDIMMADPTAAIAPVDLAQAAIGPGMAIFSKYKAVLEADGTPMPVHNALIHINKAIDDYFAHAEGDMDADTRFCIGWFQQYEYEVGPFGQADVLARAKGTSVEGVRDAGVVQAAKGEVRLLRVKEYPASWDPTKDSRLPIWEACHQMCRALGESESEAGALLARMPNKQDSIRQLAYRLYTICERKGWAEDARAYNELVTSWPAIVEESLKTGHKGSQMSLL